MNCWPKTGIDPSIGFCVAFKRDTNDTRFLNRQSIERFAMDFFENIDFGECQGMMKSTASLEKLLDYVRTFEDFGNVVERDICDWGLMGCLPNPMCSDGKRKHYCDGLDFYIGEVTCANVCYNERERRETEEYLQSDEHKNEQIVLISFHILLFIVSLRIRSDILIITTFILYFIALPITVYTLLFAAMASHLYYLNQKV